MSNLENLKINITPEPSPEELATVEKLRADLGVKIAKIDEALRNREEKLGSNLRKDEKVKFEESYNRLEAQKKVLAGQMSGTPQGAAPEASATKESLILDQYGNPFNQQEKPAITLLDQYGNPLAPAEAIKTEPKPVVNTSPVAVANTPPIVQPPAQPKAPTVRVVPVTSPAPTPNISNAPNITTAPPGPTNLSTPTITPTGPTGPTVPNGPTVTPAAPKTAEQLLAEKIRRGEPLTREELNMRRDPNHWDGPNGIGAELEKLAQPEPMSPPENFIENSGPTLERSRSDYASALFKNRKALYENKEWKKSGDGVVSPTLDPANQEYLNSLKKKYNDNIDAELEKINVGKNPEGGDRLALLKARTEFVKKERDAFNKEIFRLENEETKKRIGKALDKIASKTKSGLKAVGEMYKEGWKDLKDHFSRLNEAKEDGMGFLYNLVRAAALPTAIGISLGNEGYDNLKNKLKEKIDAWKNKDAKEKEATESDATKKLSEKFGQKKPASELKTPDVITDQMEISKKKNAFLEKTLGVELTGRNLDNWKKLSVVKTGKFFNWSRFSKPTELEKQKTFPIQQKIYDALRPTYEAIKADKTRDIKSTDKLSIDEFLTTLAKADKLN